MTEKMPLAQYNLVFRNDNLPPKDHKTNSVERQFPYDNIEETFDEEFFVLVDTLGKN